MVDEDVLRQKLVMLSEYLTDLGEIQKDISIEQFISDKKIQRYTERTLHLALECCLDIGSHIIADEGYREPMNNKDVFTVLAENNIIDQDEVEYLQKMAQFRNLLVHDYARLDPQIIYRIVKQNLGEISLYANKVKQFFLT